MKIKYIKKTRINEYTVSKFTLEKEYEVIADYRNRQSGQTIRDNGFVIHDDCGVIQMVFNDQFQITDAEIRNTFIFTY